MCDTSSQYGDHFCDIVLKFDFKKQSNGTDTNLGRTDGLTDNYMLPRIFMGSIRRLMSLFVEGAAVWI